MQLVANLRDIRAKLMNRLRSQAIFLPNDIRIEPTEKAFELSRFANRQELNSTFVFNDLQLHAGSQSEPVPYRSRNDNLKLR
jgi:hypothetical protein